MGPLDLAILHGQRELALRVAETGVDLTADGVFGIRGWLADAVELLCPNGPSSDTKQKVQSIAVDVFNLQVNRSINANMKVAAMPLLQAMGCFSRMPDGLVLRKHPAASMICGFMAQRPMVAQLIDEDGQARSTQVSETNSVDLIAAARVPLVHPEQQADPRPPWIVVPVSANSADPQIVVEGADVVQGLEQQSTWAEQEEEDCNVAAASVHINLKVPPFIGDAMGFLIAPTAQNLIKSLLRVPQLLLARTCVNDAQQELKPDLIGGAALVTPMMKEQKLSLHLALHHTVVIRAGTSFFHAALACVAGRQRSNIKCNGSDNIQQTADATPQNDVHAGSQPDKFVCALPLILEASVWCCQLQGMLSWTPRNIRDCLRLCNEIWLQCDNGREPYNSSLSGLL
jgi:hypothetical protein